MDCCGVDSKDGRDLTASWGSWVLPVRSNVPKSHSGVTGRESEDHSSFSTDVNWRDWDSMELTHLFDLALRYDGNTPECPPPGTKEGRLLGSGEGSAEGALLRG